MWLLLYSGLSVKFTVIQGCPPQSSLPIPINSLWLHSLRLHSHFHVWLLRMFVTDCFCFLWGMTGWIWVPILKAPDSVVLNEWEWQMHGLGPYEDLSLLWPPKATEVVMRKILPSGSSHTTEKHIYSGHWNLVMYKQKQCRHTPEKEELKIWFISLKSLLLLIKGLTADWKRIIDDLFSTHTKSSLMWSWSKFYYPPEYGFIKEYRLLIYLIKFKSWKLERFSQVLVVMCWLRLSCAECVRNHHLLILIN